MKKTILIILFILNTALRAIAQSPALQPFDMTSGSCVTINAGIPWVSPYIDLSTSSGIVGYYITLSSLTFTQSNIQLSFEQTGSGSLPFTATCGSIPACGSLITDGVGGWAMTQTSITTTTQQAIASGGIGYSNGGLGNLTPVPMTRFVITNASGSPITTCVFTVWKQ